MSKIYLSGQISGLPLDVARKRFANAKEMLEQQGWEVLNPLENGVPLDADWEEHMVEDILALFACKAVFMFDGWEGSQGARLEHALAKRISMRIIYQRDITL